MITFLNNGEDELFGSNATKSDARQKNDVPGKFHEMGRIKHIPINPISIKNLFWNETQSQVANEYEPNPLPFVVILLKQNTHFRGCPHFCTYLAYFGHKWFYEILVLRPIAMHEW